MSMTAIEQGSVSATAEWLHGLWEYYRGYTQTAIHAVTAAALTAFGLLIFIDPLFAILAIASYFCPPIALYVVDADAGKPSPPPESATTRADSESNSDTDPDTDSDSDDGDTDSDGADADADADGADADADG